jgi:L-lactate dehydrogenase (cytochrome)
MAKLGHPDGELNLTRAAGKAGIVHGISANSSVSLDELLDARQPNQPVFYQLYVNRDRSASERILEKIEKKGVAALILTVDAPVMGNRERDMRVKGEVVETGGGQGGHTNSGVAGAISGYIDADLVSLPPDNVDTGLYADPCIDRAGRILPG